MGSKIEGGFVLVEVGRLMAAWRACRSRPLGSGDFRSWLACREMEARRCGAPEGPDGVFCPSELAKLLGVAERTARASLRRLESAGLLESTASITAAVARDDHLADVSKMIEDSIGRGRGRLAIPRRMLRHLAKGATPATIATALGILLRCLSRRKGGFDGRGRVKAGWISRAFGVDARRVKAARKDLVDLGWICVEPSGQRAENRWGRAYRIDLAWTGGRSLPRPRCRIPTPFASAWEGAQAGGRSLPPLPAGRPTSNATPSVDPEPLREERNQEPAGRGTAGVRIEAVGEKAPTLDDIRPDDLKDTARTLELHHQAVARKLVGPSEADRLKFLALAEYARSIGRANPGGLFASLIRRGAWHFATGREEDAARRKLKDHLRGATKIIGDDPRRRSTFVPDGPPGGPSSLGSILAGFGFRANP